MNQDGTTIQADDPTVYTYGQFLPNRAATHSFNASNNASDYNRLRMDAITDTSGSETDVSYADPSTLCPGSTAPTITANSTLCYPEYWSLPGSTSSTPTLDWFNKYIVTSVTRYDDTLLAPMRQVNYSYLGTPVWHTNDSEQADAQYRTFDQFRGYAQVQSVAGNEPDNSNTKTVTTYFRGMDQDGNATYPFQDANKHVWVVDGHGDVFAPGVPGLRDDNSLAGQVLETQTYASATSNQVVSDTVNIPVDPTSSGPAHVVNLPSGGPDPGNMVTAAHDRGSGLPMQRAHFAHTAKTISYQKVSTGTRRSEVDFDYDNTLPNPATSTPGGNGRLLMADDKGDGTVQELCSITAYALQTSNTQRTAYKWEDEKTLGPCTYNMTLTNANLIADTVTLYDNSSSVGTLPSAGDPTTVKSAKSITLSNPATNTYTESWAVSGATFDGTYGRITSTTDADQHTTHTDYTPTGGALPTSYKVTNPLGWPNTTTVDQGRGIAETSTDANGHLTTEMFDGMGRLKGVWKADRPWASNKTSPNIRFTYLLNGTTPHLATTSQPAQPNGYAETETLLEDGSYAATFDIIDGFADVVQTQSPALDESHGRMIVNTRYDTLGRVMETNQPYFDQGATTPTGVWASWNDNLPAQTVTTYDGMSRPITVTQKHNGSTIAGMVATTSYPGLDRTDAVGPAGNGGGAVSATSTFTDARGRTTALWTYKNSPPSPTGNANDADVTTYGLTYNLNGTSGTTSTVTDATTPTHNVWTTTVSDLLGHQVTKSDPDTGLSTSYADDTGQILATADGRGHVLGYTYDVLGRRTGEYDGGTTADHSPTAVGNAGAQATGNGAAQLAGWAFDPAGNKGQPDASTRYSGGNVYKQQVTGYDADYRPLGNKTIIPASEGALAGTYQTNDYYSAMTGQLSYYDTPAVPNAGIAPETIYNSYNRFGLLLFTGGNADYLVSTIYDRDGKILSRTLGDYPFQIVQQNLFDAATGRVTNTFVDTTAGQSTVNPTQLNTYSIDEVSYDYDAAGRLTSTADLQNWSVSGSYNPGPAQRDIQCYTYDYASRLTNAWTDSGDQSPSATTNPNSPTTATGALGSCASSRTNNPPTDASSSTQIGGPARYWQSYAYNGTDAQSGNRTSVTDHDPAGVTANNTTRTSSYAAPGTVNTGGATNPGSGPHLLSQVTKSGAATGTVNYAYDGAGNSTLRPNGTALGQQLTWDAEDRLKHVDNNNGTTADYLYDANGNQLIRRDTGGTTGGTTLYLGGTEIHLAGANTVTANRYYSYPGAPDIIEASNGAITYQVNNSQGTGGTTVNAATGKIIARRYLKPFGDTRGTAVNQTTTPAWVDDHTFLGKTTDASTALVDIGARKYDPTTGRFISADPVFQATNPQNIGGYTYAGNDPVSASDPTGLDPWGAPPGMTFSGCDDISCATVHPNDPPPGPPDAGPNSPTAPPSAAKSKPKTRVIDVTSLGPVPDDETLEEADIRYRPDSHGPDSRYAAFAVWYLEKNGCRDLSLFASESHECDVAQTLANATDNTNWVGGAEYLVGVTALLATDGLAASVTTRFLADPEGTATIAGAVICTAGGAPCPELGAESAGSSANVITACGHSFAPGTEVLMADGSTKPINNVAVGDEIENAEPGGANEHHRVDQIHKTTTDTDFTDLTVDTPTGPKTVTGTQNHPYYDLTAGRFVNASDLKPGDRLQTTDTSETITVRSVRNYTSTMVTYDLTIDGLHTYYVVAGGTPVLVHNNDKCPVGVAAVWNRGNFDNPEDSFVWHYTERHGARAGVTPEQYLQDSKAWAEALAQPKGKVGLNSKRLLQDDGTYNVKYVDRAGKGGILAPDGTVVSFWYSAEDDN
ncbi:RHS repeat-associated core domain-containing protein [Catenulispora yoronensis]